MTECAHIITVWVGRREAHVTVSGPSGGDLGSRLEQTVNGLIAAHGRHLVIDLHRLTGRDAEVLELLAAACRRLWAKRGVMEVRGLRDRLVSRPEVRACPEVFGDVGVR